MKTIREFICGLPITALLVLASYEFHGLLAPDAPSSDFSVLLTVLVGFGMFILLLTLSVLCFYVSIYAGRALLNLYSDIKKFFKRV